MQVGLGGYKFLCYIMGRVGRHGVRAKLGESVFVVSQPQHQPAIIGGTQAPMGKQTINAAS